MEEFKARQERDWVRAIAIAGEAGSGKTTLAFLLGKRLGWDIYGAGRAYRLIQDLGKVKASDGSNEVHTMIDETMADLMRRGECVVEGRLAGLVAVIYRIPRVFKTLLLCEEDERARRIFARDPDKYLSLEGVRVETRRREADNQKVFAQRYGGDKYLDPDYYDRVIDNTYLSPKQTALVVLWTAGLQEIAELTREEREWCSGIK